MKYEAVLDILRSPRPLLMAKWGNAGITKQKSADVLNIVTETDRFIEMEASKALKKTFPEIAFVGEERGGNRGLARFWYMDPIDGTLQFVAGEPGCTSMIALIEYGVVTFSAVYDFLNDDMYWAERGHGAYCNDKKLQVSARDTLRGARIFWEIDLQKSANARLYAQLKESGVELVKWVTAGWELVQVASGSYDARVCKDPFGKEWDFAPGSLLVSEAGGTITNIGSSSYDYRNLDYVATNTALHRELISVSNNFCSLASSVSY